MIVVHIPSWFPKADKPLDGNFILKQIATITPYATCIVLHHVDEQLRGKPIEQMDANILFYPVYISKSTSKKQLLNLYFTAFQELTKQYGKPDLIHLHVALPLGFVAARLSQKYHIPLIISEHWSIYQPQNRNQLSIVQKMQLHYVYKRASYLTAVSQNLIDSIHETVPCSKDIPNRVISNVVNIELFCTEAPSPHPQKVILHISTLDNKAKNIMGILHAIDTLHNQRNDFMLNIIHDLNNQEVEEYIQEHHLEDIIHLVGKKDESEVAKAIQKCDFMLQFSNYETQSCVLLESFCCGKPVLTTPVGGIAEIANPENAIFTEPKNETQLTEKLSYMLDHYQDFDANAIRSQAIEFCSTEIIGNNFRSLYQNILKK